MTYKNQEGLVWMKKKIYRHQCQDGTNIELSDKDFKADIIKILQQAIISSLEINDKNRKPHVVQMKLIQHYVNYTSKKEKVLAKE